MLATWRDAPAAEPAVARRFVLVRCRGCGTAVTAGPPLAAAHDAGAYAPAAPRLATAAAPLLAAFDHARLRMLAGVAPPPARLLDAGAGRGRFVATARAAGYDARGLEPSAGRVAAAAAEHGVELQRGGVEDADVAVGSLDAVSAWHVLEHLEEPTEAVARFARWLVPGGALLVGVPNLASLQARLGGERWYHLDVPRHRTHFTVAGLLALLRRAGFAPRAVHHVLAEQNPFGMWQSVVNRATTTPSYLYNLLKRNSPVASPDLAATVAALPLAPVAVGLELAAGLAGRGGTVAVVAVRAG